MKLKLLKQLICDSCGEIIEKPGDDGGNIFMIRKLTSFRDFGLSIMEARVTTTYKHLDMRIKWWVIRIYNI